LFIGRMRSALSSIRDKGVAAAYRISRLTGSMLAAWRFSATQFWAPLRYYGLSWPTYVWPLSLSGGWIGRGR